MISLHKILLENDNSSYNKYVPLDADWEYLIMSMNDYIEPEELWKYANNNINTIFRYIIVLQKINWKHALKYFTDNLRSISEYNFLLALKLLLYYNDLKIPNDWQELYDDFKRFDLKGGVINKDQNFGIYSSSPHKFIIDILRNNNYIKSFKFSEKDEFKPLKIEVTRIINIILYNNKPLRFSIGYNFNNNTYNIVYYKTQNDWQEYLDVKKYQIQYYFNMIIKENL